MFMIRRDPHRTDPMSNATIQRLLLMIVGTTFILPAAADAGQGERERKKQVLAAPPPLLVTPPLYYTSHTNQDEVIPPLVVHTNQDRTPPPPPPPNEPDEPTSAPPQDPDGWPGNGFGVDIRDLLELPSPVIFDNAGASELIGDFHVPSPGDNGIGIDVFEVPGIDPPSIGVGLTPVPAPGVLSLLGIAALGFGRRRRS